MMLEEVETRRLLEVGGGIGVKRGLRSSSRAGGAQVQTNIGEGGVTNRICHIDQDHVLDSIKKHKRKSARTRRIKINL